MTSEISYVISVCCRRDVAVWRAASRSLWLNVSAVHYLVIVPDADVDCFIKASPAHFKVIPESRYSLPFAKALKDCLQRHGLDRYGWYLQQLLKLAAIDDLNGHNLLIWDADTIPLKPLTFFTPEGVPSFYSGSEYHLPYFQAIDRLLSLDKITGPSFISQNMPIPAGWGRACLREIEKRHSCSWHEAILKEVDFRQPSGFSEYETLGTYFAHRWPGRVKFRDARWTRNGGDLTGLRKGGAGRFKAEALGGADFVAVEWWDKRASRSRRLIESLLSRASGVANRIRNRGFNRRLPEGFVDQFLTQLFGSEPRLSILQIGANDGIQSDPLRKFITSRGSFRATLVEPIPAYAGSLRSLYVEREDVQVIEAAAGAETGELNLYYIPDHVALQMNGDGPRNNWAKGQGSFSRAQIVYWIWRNRFRGEAYCVRMPEWIRSIRSLAVPMIRTSDLLPDRAQLSSTLLVVDVQGYEHNVIRGLTLDQLPRWILIEQDTNDLSAAKLLRELGYTQLNDGDNLAFELRSSR